MARVPLSQCILTLWPQERNPTPRFYFVSTAISPAGPEVGLGCRREFPMRLQTHLPRKKTQIAPQTPKPGG